MSHFTIPTHRFGGEPDGALTGGEIALDFEQEDDNLFLTVNGRRTYVSLWFERTSAGTLLVSLGRVPDGGDWWEYENTIPIETEETP